MVKVALYKGITIDYAGQVFTAEIRDLNLMAPTQAELEKKIDRQLKEARRFPLEVIRITADFVAYGRVTSYDPDRRRGYFISRDGLREKPWGFGDYYIADEKTQAIAEQVRELKIQRDELYKKARALIETLGKNFEEYYKEQSDSFEIKQPPVI